LTEDSAPLAKIALKVDVDTLRGTREGVPRLLHLLAKHQTQATFLFSLGPDHTGWALKRVFRPGFLSKVSRTSVTKHYGYKTLMYGVLLPAPDIGIQAAQAMREAQAAGHECGIHTWDHVVWHDQVRHQDAAWTRAQMALSYQRFGDVFGQAPRTHGAAGWQMNEAAFEQIDDWGMAYASDGRAALGAAPYHLQIDGRTLKHLQMPTTLPTLDEVLGHGGIDESNVAASLLAQTASGGDQVYTLHAELEGGLLAPVFDQLLTGWKAQGHQLATMAGMYAHAQHRAARVLLPLWGSVAGRSGELVVAR
jgi:undecaprenyl phosphate-alpha-L-ara4FN deformylase